MHLGDALIEMIKFKMAKEGWKRTQNPGPGNSSTISDEEMDAARRNTGDPRENVNESKKNL